MVRRKRVVAKAANQQHGSCTKCTWSYKGVPRGALSLFLTKPLGKDVWGPLL